MVWRGLQNILAETEIVIVREEVSQLLQLAGVVVEDRNNMIARTDGLSADQGQTQRETRDETRSNITRGN